MTLLHEWTHSTIAWIFNYKNSPFNIYYGDCRWFLFNVDENVNYTVLFSTNRGFTASMIALSALITNALLFILSLILLSRKTIQDKKWIFLFFYWFAVMNIAELFSYIPLRTFAPSGDVGNFVHGLTLSPWVVFIPGTLLIGSGIYYLLKQETPRFYNIMSLSNLSWQRIHLIIVVFVIFFYFGGSAFHYYGMHSILSLWSLISVLIGVVVFIVFNPSLGWVKQAINPYFHEL